MKRSERKKRAKRMRMLICCAAAALLALSAAVFFLLPRGADLPSSAAVSAAPSAQPSAVSTSPGQPSPTPAATASLASASPSASPTPQPGKLETGDIVSSANPSAKKINLRQRVYVRGKAVSSYNRETPISMGTPDEYAALEGVTTFRGTNYRQNASYGTIPENPSSLTIEWSVRIGGIDDWAGVGWTGQPAIVRWDDATREIMNINQSKKDKDGLVEVIYAALDGKIHFLDLEDGKRTRSAINIGAPIKGSVTVDPRGYPLLYCGQGIDTVHGKQVKIGTRVFSLINQKSLLFINGRDKLRTRNWYAFDSAPLIDAATDTMFQLGENGLLYVIALNTDFDLENGTISIDPSVDRYGYKSNVTTRPGMENSLAVYNHYGYFADNSGLLMCVDLNTLKCVWAFPTGDDTDATCAIEEDGDGVWLYTANEIDLRGEQGNCNIRCFNALTGEVRWRVNVPVKNSSRGGAFASPSIGLNQLSELVYYNIAETSGGGTIMALNKQTGEVEWKKSQNIYSWATPLLLYDKNGAGYVLTANSAGLVRLLDGLTGEELARLDVGSNVESSPAAFDGMVVIGTRGGRMLGVRVGS